MWWTCNIIVPVNRQLWYALKSPTNTSELERKKMDLQTARCERVKAFMCWKSWEREKYGLRETHEIAFMRQSHHFKALDATEKFQCSFEQMALMNKNLLRTKAQIMLPTINALSLSLSLCVCLAFDFARSMARGMHVSNEYIVCVVLC